MGVLRITAQGNYTGGKKVCQGVHSSRLHVMQCDSIQALLGRISGKKSTDQSEQKSGDQPEMSSFGDHTRGYLHFFSNKINFDTDCIRHPPPPPN